MLDIRQDNTIRLTSHIIENGPTTVPQPGAQAPAPVTPQTHAQPSPPLPAQVTSTITFVVPDDEFDEAEESGVEEEDADEDAEDDEAGAESADDLDMEEDETLLQSRLTAEVRNVQYSPLY